jgi:hypothetical protein
LIDFSNQYYYDLLRLRDIKLVWVDEAMLTFSKGAWSVKHESI